MGIDPLSFESAKRLDYRTRIVLTQVRRDRRDLDLSAHRMSQNAQDARHGNFMRDS
jgi:hypothetical protein